MLVLSRRRTSVTSLVALGLVAALSSTAPGAPLVYVATQTPDLVGHVAVIDTAANAKIASIPVGVHPQSILAAPDGRRVYLIHRSLYGSESGVDVIDTTNNRVIKRIPLPGAWPRGAAVTPDGDRLYVTSGALLIIDARANALLGTVDVPFGGAAGIAFHPSASLAYVAHDGGVSVIETSTNVLAATAPLYNQPQALAVQPGGSMAYVAGTGSVALVNIRAGFSVPLYVPIETSHGSGPFAVAFTPDGLEAYVADAETGVTVVDALHNKAVALIDQVGRTTGVAFTPDGELAYISSRDGHVAAVDTATRDVVAEIPVDQSAVALTLVDPPDSGHSHTSGCSVAPAPSPASAAWWLAGLGAWVVGRRARVRPTAE